MNEPVLTKEATERILKLEKAIIEIAKSSPIQITNDYPLLSNAIVKGINIVNKLEK